MTPSNPFIKNNNGVPLARQWLRELWRPFVVLGIVAYVYFSLNPTRFGHAICRKDMLVGLLAIGISVAWFVRAIISVVFYGSRTRRNVPPCQWRRSDCISPRNMENEQPPEYSVCTRWALYQVRLAMAAWLGSNVIFIGLLPLLIFMVGRNYFGWLVAWLISWSFGNWWMARSIFKDLRSLTASKQSG